MKKLLTLIGSLTLIGAAGTPVIACQVANSGTSAQSEANKLMSEINGAAIQIPAEKTPTLQQEQIDIRGQLAHSKGIKWTQANELSFPDMSIKPTTTSKVAVVATVAGKSAYGSITVTFMATPSQYANMIISTITPNQKLTICPSNWWGWYRGEEWNDFVVQYIKNALVAANPPLEHVTYLKFLAFQEPTTKLIYNQYTDVKVQAKVGQALSQYVNLQVEVANMNQWIVDHIKNSNITLHEGGNPQMLNTTSNVFLAAFKAAVVQANPEAWLLVNDNYLHSPTSQNLQIGQNTVRFIFNAGPTPGTPLARSKEFTITIVK